MLGVGVGRGSGVAVGWGVAVGMGVGKGVAVGDAASVARIPACTVAGISGVDVAVGVGSAARTAASTVASISGAGVGGGDAQLSANANTTNPPARKALPKKLTITPELSHKKQHPSNNQPPNSTILSPVEGQRTAVLNTQRFVVTPPTHPQIPTSAIITTGIPACPPTPTGLYLENRTALTAPFPTMTQPRPI